MDMGKTISIFNVKKKYVSLLVVVVEFKRAFRAYSYNRKKNTYYPLKYHNGCGSVSTVGII